MNKNDHVMIHLHTSRLETRGNQVSKHKYKTYMYDVTPLKRKMNVMYMTLCK